MQKRLSLVQSVLSTRWNAIDPGGRDDGVAAANRQRALALFKQVRYCHTVWCPVLSYRMVCCFSGTGIPYGAWCPVLPYRVLSGTAIPYGVRVFRYCHTAWCAVLGTAIAYVARCLAAIKHTEFGIAMPYGVQCLVLANLYGAPELTWDNVQSECNCTRGAAPRPDRSHSRGVPGQGF